MAGTEPHPRPIDRLSRRASSAWSGPPIGWARASGPPRRPTSKQWSEPVRVEPFKNWPADDQPANTWAPEVHWDPVQKNYAILWSSATAKLESDGGHDSGGLEKDPNSQRQARHATPPHVHLADLGLQDLHGRPGVLLAGRQRRSTPAWPSTTAAPRIRADDRWVMAVKDEQIRRDRRQEHPSDRRRAPT